MFAVAFAGAASGLLAADAGAPALRLGTYVPERSVGVQQVLLPWARAVEASLGDELTIETYFGGSLGRDAVAQYDLVRHGVLDVGWILAGYTAGQFPQLEIVELPFLAASAEEASVAAWRLHEAGLVDGVHDVQVITIWTTDVAGIHSISPLPNLESIDARRIRSTGAEQAAFLELFGAASQTLGAVDANDALRRDTLDGVIQGWTGIRTFRTDAITRAVLDVPSGAIAFLLLMNKRRWQSLTPKQQSVVMQAGGERLAREAGRAYDRMGEEFESAAVRDRGYTIVSPTDVELQRYAQQVDALHQRWRDRTPNGDVVYARYLETLQALRDNNR